jgi:hypothetical protein
MLAVKGVVALDKAGDRGPLHLGGLAASGQEPLEVVGGLVELDARRAPHPVRDHPLLDQVPVPVVLVR